MIALEAASTAAVLAFALALADPNATAIPTRPDRRDPPAHTAREVSLQETGHLHSINDAASAFNEQGHATGTYDCAITVQLTIVSVYRVTATFTVNPKGGTISGTGSARFKAQGANGYFGGTISITRGTGTYKHATGTNIGISGIINRETFKLTVHVHGTMHV